MPEYRFQQVDVFTARPFFGNPVAVVLHADGVDSTEMQRIARWTNLSETTFVLRPSVPGADYRLRIFSPAAELPFAGHPTIGSAHAVLEAGLVPPDARRLVQECHAGLLPITVDGTGAQRQVFVQVPEPKVRQGYEHVVARLSAILGGALSPRPAPLAVDVGPVWLVAQVGALQTLSGLAPDPAGLTALSRELAVTGLTVFSFGARDGAAIQVRSFAPAAGIPEDPVCGSGNASVAAFLAHTGLLRETGPTYLARQGLELGRDGRVSVRVADEGREIHIGGPAVTVVDGTLRV